MNFEKLFKYSVEFFLKKFSIANYEISYEIKSDATEDYRAQLSTNVKGKMARFSLNKINCSTVDEVTKSAFHEVIELLIINLYGGIKTDEGNLLMIVADIDQRERHEVVRTLENTIYPLFIQELMINIPNDD